MSLARALHVPASVIAEWLGWNKRGCADGFRVQLGVVRLGVSHLALVVPEVSRAFLEAFLCAKGVQSCVSQRPFLEEHPSQRGTPVNRHGIQRGTPMKRHDMATCRVRLW